MDLQEMLKNIDDPSLVEQLTDMLSKSEQASLELAKAQRDLKLARDTEFREKFPRAMAAYDKGYLTFGDDTSDEATLKTLAAKEQELLDMGVQIASDAPPEASKEPEGAEAFGQPQGAASPSKAAQGPTPQQKIEEAMEAGDGRAVIRSIHMDQQEGRGRGLGAYRELTESYQGDRHPDSV